MGTRRIVTGHDQDGAAIIASDEEIPPYQVGGLGSATTLLWRRKDVARFPDDGAQSSFEGAFPPPGGSQFAVWELAPAATTSTILSVMPSRLGPIPTSPACTAQRVLITTSFSPALWD